MESETMRLAFDVLQFLLWGGTSFYVYISNKNRVTNDRITALETDLDARLEGQSVRVAKLEEAAEHAPTHGDLGELHKRVTEVGGEVKLLRGEFHGAKHVLDVIHNHLMNGTK